MKRREFVVSGSVAGAGVVAAAHLGPGILDAGARGISETKFIPEEKPVAFSVPPLTYSFDALEPYIDAKTM
ncbi:MAG TPA: hypothetical protein VFP96_07250, partial [Candidatus Acidoferrum sp.]|nr:hypothetical protein [Candidatus Acidoferrum sp.]